MWSRKKSLVLNTCALLALIVVCINRTALDVEAQTLSPTEVEELEKFAPPPNDPNIIIFKGPQSYTAKAILSALHQNKGVFLENTKVSGDLVDIGEGIHAPLFRAIYTEFDGQLKLMSYDFDKLQFLHCSFNKASSFSNTITQEFTVHGSTFNGPVYFGNLRSREFLLAEITFKNSVDFSDAKLTEADVVYMWELNPEKEPINISWSQFGEKVFGRKLEESAPTERSIYSTKKELEFWRNNFTKLDHKRDASEVNYYIIDFKRRYLMDSATERWAAFLLGIPNGYGARPLRPFLFGLSTIFLFAFIYWIRDPFIASENLSKSLKPKTPLLVFSLLFSIDTFIPFIEVTKVKEWGWEVSSSFRWVTLTERLLGVALSMLAAGSITYYFL